jgi:hypothetical protein
VVQIASRSDEEDLFAMPFVWFPEVRHLRAVIVVLA